MIKLNLGCGNRKIPGFVNVDTREEVSPDVKSDLLDLRKHFNPGSVSLIYACHVLEHFPPSVHKALLLEWKNLLNPFNGKIRLSVPDFAAISRWYTITKDMSKIQALLYGGHKYKEDYHFIAFDFKFLETLLHSCGFRDVKTYDWVKTEHWYIDDYSQSYLPHMDKVNGILMSLNVEASV